MVCSVVLIRPSSSKVYTKLIKCLMLLFITSDEQVTAYLSRPINLMIIKRSWDLVVIDVYSVCVCVFVCVGVGACVCVCAHSHVCPCVYGCMCLCPFMCVYFWVCVSDTELELLHVCVPIRRCVCIQYTAGSFVVCVCPASVIYACASVAMVVMG